jgi:hypothetical protein
LRPRLRRSHPARGLVLEQLISRRGDVQDEVFVDWERRT